MEKGIRTGTESVKDAAKSGRPVIVTGKNSVSKIRKLIVSDVMANTPFAILIKPLAHHYREYLF